MSEMEMVSRAIVIFPEFERMERIAALRRAYDPLAFGAAAPHARLPVCK